MADKILDSWLDNVWNKFNEIIQKFSNNVSLLQERAKNQKASATEIETLNSKIRELQSDYYLSSEPSLLKIYSAQQGERITLSFKEEVEQTIGQFPALICKNVATKENGKTYTMHSSYGVSDRNHAYHNSYASTKNTSRSCSSYVCPSNQNGGCGDSTYKTLSGANGSGCRPNEQYITVTKTNYISQETTCPNEVSPDLRFSNATIKA